MPKHVYLFEDPDWGIATVLPRVVPDANVVAFQTKESILEALSKNPPRDAIVLICDVVQESARAGIALARQLRFDLGVRQPIVVLSFDTESRLSASLAPIPLLSGTYLVRVPFMISELNQAIREAKPLPVQALKRIMEAYQRDESIERDRNLRHRCANFGSALRILQGAAQSGEVSLAIYRSALKDLADLAEAEPTLKPYHALIDQYLDTLPAPRPAQIPKGTRGSPSERTVLLLDDEALTAGWQIALTACLKPLGLRLEVDTNRDRFQEKLAASSQPEFDVLLLDLRMPDSPEASLDILERMVERNPAVPVIVFTALADVPNFRKCQRAGAFDYFVKELGQEDRDPLAYYAKFKEVVLRAVAYRAASQLPDAKPETLSALGRPTLDVREFHVPAWQIRSTGKQPRMYWRASFAFFLEPPSPLSLENMQSSDAKIRDDQQRLLAWLIREPADGRSLTLQYFSDPDQSRLDIAVIGSTEAEERDAAIGQAKALFANLRFYLRDADPPYVFTPVQDEKVLLRILDDMPGQHLVAIEREPMTVEVDGQALEGSFPFSGHPTSTLAATLKGLLQCQGRTVMTVTLWPVGVPKTVKQGKAQARLLQERLRNISREDQPHVEARQARMAVHTALRHGGFQPWVLDEQASRLELLRRQLDALETGGLAYRCTLASETPIANAVLATLRFDLFGHEKERWEQQAGSSLYEVRGKVRMRVVPAGELADRHQELLSLKRWCHSSVPDMSAIEEILDIEQARNVFRLPFPTPDGVIGMEGDGAEIGEISKNTETKLAIRRGFLLAQAFHKGRSVPVRLRPDDLMQHLYVCGKSGTGKSTLLLRLALSMIEQGKGLCLIDPHGDLATALCERIPDKRRGDLILFDPTVPHPLGLNLLENDGTEEQQDLIVQEFISMMMRFYLAEHMGPMFEQGFRNTLVPLMAAGKALTDFPKVWRDKAFRQSCLERLDSASARDADVLNYWETEYKKWGSSSGDAAQFPSYISSKLDRFVADAQMRKVLGQEKSGIPFQKIVNERPLLIVRLPKGILGEINAYLLGMIVSFKIRQATQARASVPIAKRKDFFLIIDEFQNFVGSGGLSYTKDEDTAFTSLLSEARKFRVGLVLANQYVHQLGPAMRNAVFGNVQSRIAFAVSGEDAGYLGEQFASSLKREDFQNLPKFHAYAQLLVNNETLPPVMVKTIPPVGPAKAPGAKGRRQRQ